MEWVAVIWEWFGGLHKIIAFLIPILTLATLILGAILLTTKDLIPSFKLLRKYRVGRVENRWWRVVWRIIYNVFLPKFLPTTNKHTTFELIRSEIEFECLEPRPKHEVNESTNIYNDKLRKWKERRREVAQNSCMKLPHPGIIHDNFEEIDRYFDVLILLNLKSHSEPVGFVIEVKLEDGYIAPIHLLAGLLQKFDEDWVSILTTLESDYKINNIGFGNNPLKEELVNLRQIQGFIYNCWLQWGQSIPLCSNDCKKFRGTLTSLQYGYGDEDQSIELVDTRKNLDKIWSSKTVGFALRAKVKGRISSTRFLPASEWNQLIGQAHRDSWNNDREGNARLILDIRNREDNVSQHNDPPIYYSAYVWAMFVILDKEKYEPATGKSWFDLIPFFEHGNIADHKNFLFAKQQLVQKTITGFEQIVKTWISKNQKSNVTIKDYPLRFNFVCSLDYSGCGEEKDFINNQEDIYSNNSATNLRNMLKAAVDKNDFLKEQDIIVFDNSNLDYASCNLPVLINNYFNHVK